MDDQKRGDDAADHPPRSRHDRDEQPRKTGQQDAPNYEEQTEGGRAIKREDVNSANDE